MSYNYDLYSNALIIIIFINKPFLKMGMKYSIKNPFQTDRQTTNLSNTEKTILNYTIYNNSTKKLFNRHLNYNPSSRPTKHLRNTFKLLYNLQYSIIVCPNGIKHISYGVVNR